MLSIDAGNYVDCYTTMIPRQISFPEFIFAFYTTPLFKLERVILKVTVSKPATDRDAKNLALGITDTFAAWSVENRSDHEILLCDYQSRTRSWLMLDGSDPRTRLYFGSAVVPKKGRTSLEFGFRALLVFHKFYSVMLLHSAALKISWRLLKAA
jgi:hypothetical protein